MWVWLNSFQSPFPDTYWTLRGFEEYEKMFGRKPFSRLTEDSQVNKAQPLLRKEFDNVIVHFGEGKLNPSTIACMCEEIEIKLLSENQT